MRHVWTAHAAAAVVLFAPTTGAAAADYFIKIPGVDGEARDKNHDKWIIIESVDWGAYRLDREAGAVRFGDGARGRRPPRGQTTAPAYGDPDRPVITGRVYSDESSAQYNETDLQFVLSRASRATPKLMQYCASGKHVAKVEIDQIENGEAVARYVLRNPRFVSFVAGDMQLTAPVTGAAARSRSPGKLKEMTLAARSLATDPTVRLVYDCADWVNRKTGAKGGNCATSKTRGDVVIKGSKIKEN